MTEEERSAARQAAIRELISLAAFIVTLVAYQATVDPVFREVWKARLRNLFAPPSPRGPREPTHAELRELFDDLREGVPDEWRS